MIYKYLPVLRLLMALGLLCITSLSFAAGPLEEEFWQEDKQKHFALSAVTSATTYSVLRSSNYSRWESLVTGVAVGILVGTAKEVYDRRVDPDDIKADAAGGIFGGGVAFTVDWVF
jgi:hypothetical protein